MFPVEMNDQFHRLRGEATTKKKIPKIKIKEDTQRQGESGKWGACPSKRVIIPGFLIAAGTRSREEKKERGLGGRNLLRSERAAWAGAPGERHRNVRSDSIWQGVPAVVSRPLSPESAHISRGLGSSCAPCHAVCGGTTHAVGSKGCGTLRGSGPPPPSLRGTTQSPHITTNYHCHHHQYNHYNRDLPLATSRAGCGNVTRCDPISLVDPFILHSPFPAHLRCGSAACPSPVRRRGMGSSRAGA